MLRFKDKLFYGWVVVLSFLIIGTTIWGIRFSFGVFFKSIASEFSLNRAETSVILSANIVLGCGFAILAGWALDRYGPRIVLLLMGIFAGLGLLLTSQTNSLWQLFITYSLLLAMGGGAIFTVIMSTLSRWFDKKRGLALGIGGSGSGLGTMVMVPFATFLIATFDWRMAFIVMGGIAWVIVLPLSRLLKRDPYEIGTLPDGAKSDSRDMHVQKPKNEEGNIQPADLSILWVFRTRSFWLFLFIWLFYGYNMFLILTHLVPHVTDIGFSAVEAAVVLSLVGGMGAVGIVLMGIVSDIIGRKLTAVICALLQAGALVWLIWSHDLWMFYLFAAVWGLAYGGITPCIAALIGDTFALGRIGTVFGFLEIGFTAGGALGPFIGGLIFDVSGTYFMAFLIGALAMFMATLLLPLIRREMGRNLEAG